MLDPAAEPDRALGDLWWHVLGEPESSDDEREGFVSLGGYSLAAARFVGAAREQLGVDVPLDLLLRENAALADIRRYLASSWPASRTAPRPVPQAAAFVQSERTVQGGASIESPLAPSQWRLWMLNKLHPEAAAYNVLAALRLRGALSIKALRAALADTTARHEALRACVVEDASAQPQLRYTTGVVPQLVVRQAQQPLSARLVEDFVRTVAAQPIAIDTAPLLRAELLCAAETGFYDACLVMSIHHIVADQRSMDLILSDLAKAYAARLDGHSPHLGPAPSFAEHAEAETALRASRQWADDLAYWRETLRDPPEIEALPFRLRSSPAPSFQGDDHNVVLGPDLTAKIDAYVRARGVTPAVLALACIATVSCAWSGADRTVIGLPASRRRDVGSQDLVGFLVETLPILIEVGRHRDLAALVEHVRDRHIGAMSHSTPTFDAIVETLGLPQRPITSPLFQMWFNDLTQGAAPPAMSGLNVTAVPTVGFAALFELNVYLHRDQNGFRLQLVRAVDRVNGDVAREFLDQCCVVLDHILANGASSPTGPSLMTPRAAALWEGVVQPGRTVDREHVTWLSRHDPAAIVLSTPSADVSYSELGHAVAALAEQLSTAGVGSGAIVEIHARRAGGLPAAALACWRLGAVAAFVDGTVPAGRLAECRRLLRPTCVLSVDPRAPADAAIEEGSDRPRHLHGASHILFTSGSSAQQLAVVVPQGAMESAFTWYRRRFAPSETDRVALLAGLGHDPLLRDILVPLQSGGTLVVPPQDVFTNPGTLLDLLAVRGITILHATPALLELLLAGHASRMHVRLNRMRLIVSTGAPLTAGLVRRLRALTSAAIVNAYGTTETPQIASCHHILGYGESADGALALLGDDAVLPIGRGVAGAALLICASDGRPAGVGQLGEILVRGKRLAVGYLQGGEPQARFIGDPLNSPGMRAFRTGDLGRLGPDGLVHIAGRIDRQLIIDGFRVAPEEIESAALRLPIVSQAAAGMVDGPAGPALTLQVVTVPGTSTSVEAIRSHLGAHLPTYAMPAVITVVPKLPTNANHKIVLGAFTPGAVAPGRFTLAGRLNPAPRLDNTSIDELTGWLAAVLRAVAGYAIDPEQNFFEAGLTSMSLLRLHAHLAVAIPDAPPAMTLFTYPTLRAFARFLVTREVPKTPARRRRGSVDSDGLQRDAQMRRDIRFQRSRDGGPATGEG